ncbi:MAG: TRAP transporter small permease [Firmicutes bacterium]|nr:TRAP transporter small permease [Bacillota bacterium]
MKKLKLYSFVKIVTFSLFFVMTVVVFWQVVARYFLKMPLSWSTELSKILMVWMTFMGITMAFYEKAHPNITFLVDKFPEGARKTLDFLINIMLLIGFVVIAYYGIRLCMKTQNKVTTVLKMPMCYEYAALPVSMIMMSIGILKEFADRFGKGKEE